MKLAPMFPILGSKKDLQKPGWIFETELNGIRALLYFNKFIKLIDENNVVLNSFYSEFSFSKNILAKSCIIDGEIIIYDKYGNIDINLLSKRNYLKPKIFNNKPPATYVVSDILMKNGRFLLDKPLIYRKKILARTVKEDKQIQLAYYTLDGRKLWNYSIKKKFNGVITKYLDSKYYPGEETDLWLKIVF